MARSVIHVQDPIGLEHVSADIAELKAIPKPRRASARTTFVPAWRLRDANSFSR
jgi:hypothetical protein